MLPKTSLILGIEASTQHAGIAVADGGSVIAESELPSDGRHSATLVPALDALLKRAGLALKQIGGIAVGIGPGSFTGIRMGLATARGLALALDIPLRGIGGFDNLLSGYRGSSSRVCAIVNAHSHGLYAAVYERKGSAFVCAREPFVAQPADLAATVAGEVFFMGPHLGKFRELLARLFGTRASFDDADCFPRASTAALLYESPLALRDEPQGAVGPLYLLPGVRVKSVSRKP